MINYPIQSIQFIYGFYYFVIYCFIGWCMEVCFAAHKEKKFVNRGFLNGPFCPIYGMGASLLLLILEPLKRDPALLFAIAIVITSILEYTTGFILEKSFHHTWWNYSSEPLNLHGRICLKFSILWGILAEVIVYLIHPTVSRIVILIPGKYMVKCMYFLAFYFFIDFSIVSAAILHLNARLKQLHLISEEIKLRVEHLRSAAVEKSEGIEVKIHGLRTRYEHLLNKGILGHARLIEAFPDLKSINFDYLLKELKHKIEFRKKVKKL